jgi:predicted RNase H-like HicB family nuclease
MELPATITEMREHTATHKTRAFAVLLRREPEGGFTVHVPELPEIVTFGKDEKEALAMAQDAIQLVLEDSKSSLEALSAEVPRIREIAVSIS